MTVDQSHEAVRLDILLKDLVAEDVLQSCSDVYVNNIVLDHRKANPGDLFIAYQGLSSHGLLHAQGAIDKGVSVILWDGECEHKDEILQTVSRSALCLHCENLKQVSGVIASRYHDRPSRELNVIGVTGTDGKTSIAHFIAQCLDSHDVHCGVMGTLGNGFIHDLHPTGLTTADALKVQESLAEIKDAGAKHVVMEVSSHGLDQGRINGVEVKTAILSNFSQDHLDYHDTIEEYAQAKKKLFSVPGLKTAIINLDDEFGRELAKDCKSRLCVWGYSMQSDIQQTCECADYIIVTEKIEATETGYRLSVKTPKGSGSFDINLLGYFNVSNILASLAALLVSEVTFEEAIRKLSTVHPVSGRMEIIAVPDRPIVIVDYAHTPQGLTAACSAVREHFSGDMWCVFGCGGDRDKSKRPLMAKVAEKYADHIIVTSDNPRFEKPELIIEEIMSGFVKLDNVEVMQDRKSAIYKAVQAAKVGDVILLAGKGHEASQIVDDVHIAFDDRRVARESLGVVT